ncbi:MAG: rhodanese-related sulfurtransferase [Nodosilinea sp.]
MTWIIATFYKFVPLVDVGQIQRILLVYCQQLELRGTILLAPEGINATVVGRQSAIDHLLTWLASQPQIGPCHYQAGIITKVPFERLKVKLKSEIVALGKPEINPADQVGVYVEPEDWNSLISDPEVMVIDTRNAFEVEVGSFKGAVNPQTRSFRELPAYVANHLDPVHHPQIAMFCTGGIRCEKATAYLLKQGFQQVYHLKGGILNYLRRVPPGQSLWQGECFVFDQRVSLNHQLETGSYQLCQTCGYPIRHGPLGTETDPGNQGCPQCSLAAS